MVTAKHVIFISGNRATRGGLFLLAPQAVCGRLLVRKLFSFVMGRRQRTAGNWSTRHCHKPLHLSHKLSSPSDAILSRSACLPLCHASLAPIPHRGGLLRAASPTSRRLPPIGIYFTLWSLFMNFVSFKRRSGDVCAMCSLFRRSSSHCPSPPPPLYAE